MLKSELKKIIREEIIKRLNETPLPKDRIFYMDGLVTIRAMKDFEKSIKTLLSDFEEMDDQFSKNDIREWFKKKLFKAGVRL